MVKISIGIYKIENKITNKVYIGQSTDIEKRIRDHKSSIGKIDRDLYNDMEKYGIDNFSFEILEECQEKELDYLETKYIEKFDSFSNGYNLTTGGNKGCVFDRNSINKNHETIPKEPKTKITNNLRSILDKQNKSLYWLSKQTGVTYANLFKLANNQSNSIRFDVLYKILNSLDCNIEDLFNIKTEERR